MGLISPDVKSRIEFVATQVIPSVSSQWVSDLAERLLEKFPQLQTAKATSLKEAVAIAAPWIKAAGIAAVTSIVTKVIGASGLALSTTVLLSLAVFAVGLYLIYKVGPSGVSEKLEELFDSMKVQFNLSAISPDEFSKGYKTASLGRFNGTAIA